MRKEKQYQLLEKLQGQEEAKRQAEDQVSGMEDKLRQLHAKNVELDTQLQVETRARHAQEDTNRKQTVELSNVHAANRELREALGPQTATVASGGPGYPGPYGLPLRLF